MTSVKVGDRVFSPEFGKNGTVTALGIHGEGTCQFTLDEPAYAATLMYTLGFFVSQLEPEKK